MPDRGPAGKRSVTPPNNKKDSSISVGTGALSRLKHGFEPRWGHQIDLVAVSWQSSSAVGGGTRIPLPISLRIKRAHDLL